MDRAAHTGGLKFLLAFAGWATLAFVPAWFVSHAWQHALGALAARAVAPSGTELEVLEILPPERMGELLKKELKDKGFKEEEDGTLTRKEGNITVKVDPKSCEVSVKADVEEEVSIEAKRETFGYDDVGPNQKELRDRVKKQLEEDLEKKAEKETERLQGQATEELEKKLCDLQPELSDVVNKVTRQAIKEKAQQMGTVKELSENEETGELTIKIEV